jgi:hypothetical protein
MNQRKQAQSTMEYILLVGGFIGVVIILLRPNGIFHNSISNQINKAVDQIETMTQHTNFENSEVEY